MGRHQARTDARARSGVVELVDDELGHGPEHEPDAGDGKDEGKDESNAEAADAEVAHGGIIGRSGDKLEEPRGPAVGPLWPGRGGAPRRPAAQRSAVPSLRSTTTCPAFITHRTRAVTARTSVSGFPSTATMSAV
jgi:hypothetical protein